MNWAVAGGPNLVARLSMWAGVIVSVTVHVVPLA
jgi:hypothetical protein